YARIICGYRYRVLATLLTALHVPVSQGLLHWLDEPGLMFVERLCNSLRLEHDLLGLGQIQSELFTNRSDRGDLVPSFCQNVPERIVWRVHRCASRISALDDTWRELFSQPRRMPHWSAVVVHAGKDRLYRMATPDIA